MTSSTAQYVLVPLSYNFVFPIPPHQPSSSRVAIQQRLCGHPPAELLDAAFGYDLPQ